MRRRIGSVKAASNKPSIANTSPRAAPKSRIAPARYLAGAASDAGLGVGVMK